MTSEAEYLDGLIRDIPDFPKPGVVFKDLTPLWADRRAFCRVVDAIVHHFIPTDPDRVLGIEARGFIVAAPIAYRLGAGFVPARKTGKLPGETSTVSYELEYGVEQLEIHTDAIGTGNRVLIVDDVLATGGTAEASVKLVRGSGAEVVGMGVIVELGFLGGRKKVPDLDLLSLVTYDS